MAHHDLLVRLADHEGARFDEALSTVIARAGVLTDERAANHGRSSASAVRDLGDALLEAAFIAAGFAVAIELEIATDPQLVAISALLERTPLPRRHLEVVA